MAKSRFDAASSFLELTTRNPPETGDKFWEVRELIAKLDQNVAHQLSTGWVTCLDVSVSIWHSGFTHPGWMFVPQEFCPFGDESVVPQHVV